jgi:drug/metabolite transporter (DMT)-like permease
VTWLGVVLAFAAAVANALALVLQAMEARESPAGEGETVALLLDLARRPRWLFGTLLVMIAWPLQIAALSFAAITIVQPILASFQLVILILARFWLKERTRSREWGGALAIVAGVCALILAAPQRSVLHPSAARLAPPLALLGVLTLGAYQFARRRHAASRDGAPSRRSTGLVVTVTAGLGYAWADFVDKLVSNNLTSHDFIVAALWLATVMAMGALAFTSEQTALQQRPASTVGPLIGALQEPLPVVLALWSGLEEWQGGAGRAIALAVGLVLVGIGAAVIAGSPAVAGVAEAPPAGTP